MNKSSYEVVKGGSSGKNFPFGEKIIERKYLVENKLVEDKEINANVTDCRTLIGAFNNDSGNIYNCTSPSNPVRGIYGFMYGPLTFQYPECTWYSYACTAAGLS